MTKEIEQSAIEMRRAYQREWRRKNPDKVRANTMRYWAKKAETAKKEAEAPARTAQ